MRNRQLSAGLMVFVWAAAVVTVYYIFHKPLSPQVAIALSPLAVAAGALAVGHVLGARLIPADADLSMRGRLALAIGLGLGMLGVIQLGLTALGWLTPLIGVAAIALAAFTLLLAGRWREWRSVFGWPSNRIDRGLAAFCALMLGAALLIALSPPTAWDALVYHLTGPRWYMQAGGLHHDRDLAYLGFPQWGEMLFLWAMLLGGDRSAAIMHWVFAPLTLMLMPDLMRSFAPGRAWLAAAILLSASTAALLAGWAYVEWMMMFAITAGALAIVRSRETASPKWLAMAGAFAGLAFGAKYTAAGAIAGLGVATLMSGRDTRYAIRNTFWFGLPAFLAILPWLIKNYALTGNPVYPFFLPGKFWDLHRAVWYGRGGTGLPIIDLLIAPWEMTVLGIEGSGKYGATLGPLWLVLLASLVVGWSGRPRGARQTMRVLLVVVGVAYAVWLAQAAWSALLVQSRLLLSIFPILACLCAAGFDGLAAISSERLRVQWLIGAVIGVVLALTGVEWAQNALARNPLTLWLGRQNETDYLRQELGWYAIAVEGINKLPEGSKVIFLWEPRTYHCAEPKIVCEPDALLDRWWHLRQTEDDPSSEAIAALWRAAGATHVLVFETGRAFVQSEKFDPLTAKDWAELEKLRASLTLVEDFGGAYQLYAMNNEQ
jgi:hypothetical protein